MRFWCKRQLNGRILAACDEELLEKEFEEGEIILRVTREFYGEELIDEETLKKYLEEAEIISLVGEKAVAVATELGYVEKGVKKVLGIPFTNIYKI